MNKKLEVRPDGARVLPLIRGTLVAAGFALISPFASAEDSSSVAQANNLTIEEIE